MEIQSIYNKLIECNSVCTDTRNINKKDFFIALKGENFNGNKFAKQAINQGAKYALIDEDKYKENDNYILCDNCLDTLQQLANFHRNQMNATVIAITGTNGKTTSKELSYAVLSSHYNCIATKGNLNNHIGVPLTILQIKNDTEIAIIEMGANHPGEIKTLAEIAQPDFGLITNVGTAHIEGFGSFQGVKETKAELYNYLDEVNGIAFVNIDNCHLISMLNTQEIISYSFEKESHCYATSFKENNFIGISWKYGINSGNCLSHLMGGYNSENILAAICLGNYFNIPSEKIDNSISNYIPTNKRSELKQTKSNKLFLDLYNANPSSMELAIKDFHNISENQILILGDMKELGSYSNDAHKNILDLIDNLDFTTVFLCGEEFYEQRENYDFCFYKSTESLKEAIIQFKPQNYWIFIKGSRSMHLENIIEFL